MPTTPSHSAEYRLSAGEAVHGDACICPVAANHTGRAKGVHKNPTDKQTATLLTLYAGPYMLQHMCKPPCLVLDLSQPGPKANPASM